MMTYVMLFWEFFKIGLFAVGGGLATLPFLTDLTVTHPEWYDMATLSDMVAVSNSTPGPLGINMATYVGYHVGGILGGVLATISLVLPSVVVILLVARVLDKFRNSQLVQGAFQGLRPAVTGLIALAGLELMKISLMNLDLYQQTRSIGDLFNWAGVVFFVIMIPLVRKTKWPIICYILIGAVAGILFHIGT